jgi:2-keto-4-pentenoate hydratase/2-oxohepta-3-ene-1,7-dioic acid hydratase in catechol pathway
MKLVRFGAVGAERPGIVDHTGAIRDLSGFIEDIRGEELSPARLKAIEAIGLERLPVVADGVRLGCPISGVSKIIGVGLNYRDHARECGAPIAQTPILFLKPTTSIGGPNDTVELPPDSMKTDWEVELAVVIGLQARNVPVSKALGYVAGYCIAHDVSERAHQLELGTQWTKGKSHDGFCPLGPWLVTAHEVGDPQTLDLWCEVNGKTVQKSNTSDMIFSVAECIADASRYMTLMPGDVIITGTPAGVGLGQVPQRYLAAGDQVRLGIERLGEQRQTFVAFGSAGAAKEKP